MTPEFYKNLLIDVTLYSVVIILGGAVTVILMWYGLNDFFPGNYGPGG